MVFCVVLEFRYVRCHGEHGEKVVALITMAMMSTLAYGQVEIGLLGTGNHGNEVMVP